MIRSQAAAGIRLSVAQPPPVEGLPVAYGLDILLADPDPDQSAMLARYLLAQGHRVVSCLKGSEIVSALRKARANDSPIALLILGQDLRGSDGITCLEHIQGMDQTPACIFLEPLAGLTPTATAHVRALGCKRILPSPVDLGRLQRFIDDLARPSDQQDVPFFGTTHMLRKSATEAAPRPPSQPKPSGSGKAVADPFAEADAAHARHFREDDLTPPGGGRPQTGRSSSGKHRTRSDLYATSFTQRRRRTTGTIRRSVTGRIEQQTETERLAGTMTVRCAHCSEPFAVPRRDRDYTVMCIHCGKLNRIPAAFPPPPGNA